MPVGCPHTQQQPGPCAYSRSRYGAGGVRNVPGSPLPRSPSRQVQPLGAPRRAARARARRSARKGWVPQYDSIASRGVGGTKGRLSARDRTPDGKMVGNALLRRASDCRFLSAFSSCQPDMGPPPACWHHAIENLKYLLSIRLRLQPRRHVSPKILLHVGYDDANEWKVIVLNDQDDVELVIPFTASYQYSSTRRPNTADQTAV
jgi:hypothetical protein